jgi:hypothetical protein
MKIGEQEVRRGCVIEQSFPIFRWIHLYDIDSLVSANPEENFQIEEEEEY